MPNIVVTIRTAAVRLMRMRSILRKFKARNARPSNESHLQLIPAKRACPKFLFALRDCSALTFAELAFGAQPVDPGYVNGDIHWRYSR